MTWRCVSRLLALAVGVSQVTIGGTGSTKLVRRASRVYGTQKANADAMQPAKRAWQNLKLMSVNVGAQLAKVTSHSAGTSQEDVKAPSHQLTNQPTNQSTFPTGHSGTASSEDNEDEDNDYFLSLLDDSVEIDDKDATADSVKRHRPFHNEKDETHSLLRGIIDSITSPPALMVGQPKTADSCVRVFVYDISGPCSDQTFGDVFLSVFHKDDVGIPEVFGRVHNGFPWLRETSQFQLAAMLHYRFMTSKCRTLNPEEADLFFVPVLTRAKTTLQLVEACQRCSVRELQPQLLHLNKNTAHKHMIAISKEHYVAQDCKGWWSYPTELFAPVIRLAHSVTLPDGGNQDFPYDSNRKLGVTYTHPENYPNLHSLPFVSMVHWSSMFTCKPPWEANPRDILMLFVGSDGHGDVQVRKRLTQQCLMHDDPSVCTWAHPRTPTDIAAPSLKMRAKFCLEPAGDSPNRRSITDSILMGCIPVLFNKATDLIFSTMHRQWGDWRNSSRILVPRDSFLRENIDLKQLLTSIPQDVVAAMQRGIREHAQSFQIATEEEPGDLVSKLVKSFAAA